MKNMWKCLTLHFRQFKWLENYSSPSLLFFLSPKHISYRRFIGRFILSSPAQNENSVLVYVEFLGDSQSASTRSYQWLILLPICNYEACFSLHWGFSLKQRGQSRNKRDSSVEPWTRATKPTCLFPPSNKAVGTTHPNYISATCHEWYSWVAKINHIQKPVPGCSDPIPSAHLLLQRTEKAHTK